MHRIQGVSKLAVLLLGLVILGAPLGARATNGYGKGGPPQFGPPYGPPQYGPYNRDPVIPVPEPASPVLMGIAGSVLVAAFAGKLLSEKRQSL